MKAMDSLLALSVLATLGAGAANAATVATYDVVATPLDIIYHFPETTNSISGEITSPAHDADILARDSSYGISGSAVLDDSGSLTITYSYREATAFGTDRTLGEIVTFYGSVVGDMFSVTSGNFHFASCVDNPSPIASCDFLPLNFEFPLTSVMGSASPLTGTFVTTWSRATFDQHIQYVLSNGTPAVPVPAAAWLFGSGLLGLFGATRRRRAAN